MTGVQNQDEKQPLPGSEDLYTLLGLEETATATDIKHAYYRLVRKWRPSDHPEVFKQFTQARTTLSDPVRRTEYDQTRRYGERVQALVERATAAMEQEVTNAIPLLKQAIGIAPDLPVPHALLAQALLRIESYPAAETELRWLLTNACRDETLHYQLGRCLWLQDRPKEAEESLTEALIINPVYHDAQVLLSRVYQARGQFVRAVDAVERAIAIDDVENYADFEMLLRLLALHLQNDNRWEAERAVRRIEAVLPEDAEDPAAITTRLHDYALRFHKAGSFAAAYEIVQIARRRPARDPETAEAIAKLGDSLALMVEAEGLSKDDLIRGHLKTYLHARYLERATESVKQQRLSTIQNNILAEIAGDTAAAARTIEYLRREYPRIATEQKPYLDVLVQRIEKLSPASAAASASQSFTYAAPSGDGKKGLLGWLRGPKK